MVQYANDGRGHNFAFDNNGGWSRRMFDGYDPHAAWGGDNNAIFVDVNGTTLWVAPWDSSYEANLGITACNGYVFVRPHLSGNFTRYCVSTRSPVDGTYDVYTFGGGGSGLTHLVSNASAPGRITYDGSTVYFGSWNGSDYAVGKIFSDGSGFTLLPLGAYSFNSDQSRETQRWA